MSTDKPMPQIFLSYRWSNSDVADAIDNDFKAVGITFLRDVRDVKYRGSIKEFMNRVGKSDFIVMIISDEYLRSINCMYEVMELLNSHEFEKRILPVKLDNAKAAFNIKDRMQYYEYWQQEMDEARERLNKHINEDTLEQYRIISDINNKLGSFLKKLTELNVWSYETLKQQNYKPIFDILNIEDKNVLIEAIAIDNIEDQEDKDIAIETFSKKYSNNKFGLFLKAYNADEKGLFKLAKVYYEDLINKYQDYAIGFYNLALISEEQFQHYEEAKRYYEKAIEINPYYVKAHHNLGLILEKQFNNYPLAKLHYEKAIEINPYYIDAYYNLAILITKYFNNYLQARSYYEKAIIINPNYAKAHNNLAILLKNHFNDYVLSKLHYEKAIQIDSNYANAHYNLANLLLEKFDNVKSAKEHYIIATNLNPESINKKLDIRFEIKR
jgi:tetratricopeptide (TPR) repeat protein